MTDRELDEVEREFAELLDHLAKNPTVAKMSAPDGFKFLAGIFRSHSARVVEVQLRGTVH